jgi:hypothetical protein
MDATLSDEDLAFREEIRAVFRDEFPSASSSGCTNTAGPA